MLTIKRHTFYRFVTVILIALICLGVFASTGAAQEPNLFKISLQAEAEQAISGQPFTYLVTVTNISREPVQNVLVTVEIPEGTTFIETSYTNVNWYGGNPNPATDITEIKWFTVEPVLPNEVVTFKLTVRISPEKANSELLLENYGIAIDSTEPIIFGLPVRTKVVALLTPTPLPTPTHTAQIPTIASKPTGTFTPIPTVSTGDGTSQGEQFVNNQAVVTPDDKSGIALNGVLVIGALALVLMTGLGLWVFKNLHG